MNEDIDKDKFWLIIPTDDKDIRYKSRKEAQDALIKHGESGYVLKSVAYISRPEIKDIR